MAKNNWVGHSDTGYCGTDVEEEILLTDLFDLTQEELEEMSDEKAAAMVSDYMYDQAVEGVSSYAE